MLKPVMVSNSNWKPFKGGAVFANTYKDAKSKWLKDHLPFGEVEISLRSNYYAAMNSLDTIITFDYQSILSIVGFKGENWSQIRALIDEITKWQGSPTLDGLIKRAIVRRTSIQGKETLL